MQGRPIVLILDVNAALQLDKVFDNVQIASPVQNKQIQQSMTPWPTHQTM